MIESNLILKKNCTGLADVYNDDLDNDDNDDDFEADEHEDSDDDLAEEEEGDDEGKNEACSLKKLGFYDKLLFFSEKLLFY